MCKSVSAFFFLGLGAVLCVPLKDGLMVHVGGDTAVVESTVREARQAPEHIEELIKPGELLREGVGVRGIGGVSNNFYIIFSVS